MVKTAKYPTEQRATLSYLLRLWREGDDDRPEWRVSLRSTHSGEQFGLASLEDLYRFLQCQTGTTPKAEPDGQEP
jgi:hypothetical protein